MLELRPNCELCDKDLAPDSTEAMICTYECTFCAGCVETRLQNVCPNCGGGFSPRPIRPKQEHRPGVGLSHQAASNKRRSCAWSEADIRQLVTKLAGQRPEDR